MQHTQPKERPVNTQSERKPEEPSTTQQPGDLKASDFFPPGVGWNQAGGEQDEEEELRQRRQERPQQSN